MNTEKSPGRKKKKENHVLGSEGASNPMATQKRKWKPRETGPVLGVWKKLEGFKQLSKGVYPSEIHF